jgi:hypothetical protein
MSVSSPPKKNTIFTHYVSLSAKDGSGLLTNPTLATGDVQVSTDGGTLGNLDTLPVVTPASSRAVLVTLTQAEMNGDDIVVIFVDAAGDEWNDLFLHIKTSTDQIDDLATPTEVNAQVVDAINTDAYSEPAQGAPPVSASLVTKVNYLYKAFRNKITQSTTTLNIYDDAGSTVDHKATVSDDTVTFTRGELETGP